MQLKCTYVFETRTNQEYSEKCVFISEYRNVFVRCPFKRVLQIVFNFRSIRFENVLFEVKVFEFGQYEIKEEKRSATKMASIAFSEIFSSTFQNKLKKAESKLQLFSNVTQ